MNIKLTNDEFDEIITKWGDIKKWVNFEEIGALIIEVCINPDKENLTKKWVLPLFMKPKTIHFLTSIKKIIGKEIKYYPKQVDNIDIYLVGILKGNETIIDFDDIPVGEFDTLIFSYYTRKIEQVGGEGGSLCKKRHYNLIRKKKKKIKGEKMSNKKKVVVDTIETVTEFIEEDIKNDIFIEYLKVVEEMKPLNKQVKKYQGDKKTIEQHFLSSTKEGDEYVFNGYVFTHIPAETKKEVKEDLDIEALVKFLKENTPDVIEEFSKERIVEKQVKAKMSVKKEGK